MNDIEDYIINYINIDKLSYEVEKIIKVGDNMLERVEKILRKLYK